MVSRHASLSAAIIAAFLLVGCTHTPPNLGPQAQLAFKADQVILHLGEIQSTAIDANHTGGLPDRIEIPLVQFTVAAIKTIRDVPDGWLPTVRTGVAQLKAAISEADRKTYAAYFLLIDTVLASSGGTE